MEGGKDGNPTGMPTINRGESSAKAHPSAAFRKSTELEALSYLKKVKDTLQNEDKYNKFREALIDLRDQKINMAELIARVKELFKDHCELIPGFNFFLPFSYRIILLPGPPADYKGLLRCFVTKLKARFKHDECSRNAAFRIISQHLHSQLKLSNELHKKVESLFKEHHEDLYVDYCSLFPGIVHPTQHVSKSPQSKQPANRDKTT